MLKSYVLIEVLFYNLKCVNRNFILWDGTLSQDVIKKIII